MSKFLNEWYENHKKEEYEKQYVLMPDGTEKHVTAFKDKSVDCDTYKDLRMNSYAKDKFFSKMDDELLVERAKYFMSQCDRYNYPAATYDDALIHVIVPELIERLECFNNIVRQQYSEISELESDVRTFKSN